MVPTTLGTVAAFLLLLAPGFVWTRLDERHKMPVKETTFSEISTTILVSLVAVVASAGLLFWIWLPLLGQLRLVLAEDPAADVLTVGLAVIATSAGACGLAALVHWCIHRAEGRVSRATTVWSIALDQRPPDKAETVVEVRLANGDRWRGTAISHDIGAEDPNPKILIGSPLALREPGDRKFTLIDERQWEQVVLQTRDIVTLRVSYTGEREVRVPWHQRLWKRRASSGETDQE